jgi:hypothetical protein
MFRSILPYAVRMSLWRLPKVSWWWETEANDDGGYLR